MSVRTSLLSVACQETQFCAWRDEQCNLAPTRWDYRAERAVCWHRARSYLYSLWSQWKHCLKAQGVHMTYSGQSQLALLVVVFSFLFLCFFVCLGVFPPYFKHFISLHQYFSHLSSLCLEIQPLSCILLSSCHWNGFIKWCPRTVDSSNKLHAIIL